MTAFSIRDRIFIFFFSVVTASLACQVVAQDSSSNSDTDGSKQFAGQLWNYLLSNNYKHWSPAVGNKADHYASPIGLISQTKAAPHLQPHAHGTLLKSYVNRTAHFDEGTFPNESILILENYRKDKSLASISVMYRTDGFDPDAKDWYWVKYNPDGSVANAPQPMETIVGKSVVDSGGTQQTQVSNPTAKPIKLKGRVRSCAQCHQKAGGGDWVFFNDKISRQQKPNK